MNLTGFDCLPNKRKTLPVSIRAMKRVDIPRVQELHVSLIMTMAIACELTRDTNQQTTLAARISPAFYISALINSSQLCLVALAQSKTAIVGCLSAMLDSSRSTIYITTLCVSPAYRHQGIASLLMQALPKCTSSTLHCAASNQQARRFYERQGYIADITLPGFYRGVLKESDAILYKKESRV